MASLIVYQFCGYFAYISKVLTLRIQYLPTEKCSIRAFETHGFSPGSALNTQMHMDHERIKSNSY